MNELTVLVAKYLLYVMCAGFAAAWLMWEPRRGKVELVVQALIGLIFCGIFIYLAGHLHDDPRPFVDNPSLKPLFPHAPDNGFPSDHSTAAGLIATLILVRHRLAGVVLWLCAGGIAAARVAAHVHHVQDVVAGLVLGGLAAVLGIVLTAVLMAHTPLLIRAAGSAPADVNETGRHRGS